MMANSMRPWRRRTPLAAPDKYSASRFPASGVGSGPPVAAFRNVANAGSIAASLRPRYCLLTADDTTEWPSQARCNRCAEENRTPPASSHQDRGSFDGVSQGLANGACSSGDGLQRKPLRSGLWRLFGTGRLSNFRHDRPLIDPSCVDAHRGDGMGLNWGMGMSPDRLGRCHGRGAVAAD